MNDTPITLVSGPALMGRHDIAQFVANHYRVMPTKCSMHTTAEEYVQYMQPALDRERPVVLDGCWIDQQIHSAATRKHYAIKPVHTQMLCRLAVTRVGAVIFARTSLKAFLMNMAMKQPLTAELINLAHQIYYDFEFVTDDTGEAPVKIVNPTAEQLQDTLTPWLYRLSETNVNSGPGIGVWRPGRSILLVGDRHGPSLQPYQVKLNVAFVSLSGVGCSEWLTSQLSPTDEEQLYWINAYDRFGLETDPSFIALLKPRAIIALGNAAEFWCVRHKLDYLRVPHPQYWKRFKSSEPYELLKLIRTLD